MEFVEWSEKFSTGNVLVDAYHHIFFQMVQEFGAALEGGEAVSMAERIGFLVDYTFMHFESEERLMAKAAYPDAEEHMAVHAAFRERVLALKRTFDEQPDDVKAGEVLSLMQDWFAHHILGSDLQFRPFLGA